MVVLLLCLAGLILAGGYLALNAPGVNLNVSHYVWPDKSLAMRQMHWLITDLKSGQTLKSIRYDFRMRDPFTIYKDRFLITRRPDVIEVIDSADAKPITRFYRTGSPDRRSRGKLITAIDDTDAIVMSNYQGPAVQPIELLHVDNQGVLRWRTKTFRRQSLVTCTFRFSELPDRSRLRSGSGIRSTLSRSRRRPTSPGGHRRRER